MNKIERFYSSLGEPIQASNGDYGYFVIVGELVKNGGADEFYMQLENGVIVRTSTGYRAIANNGSSEFFSITNGFDPLREAIDFVNEEANKQ